MKNIILILLTLTLADCASGPAYDPNSIPALPKDTARIFVMRDFALVGSGNSATVKLDGKTIANLWGDSFCYLDIKPGLHELLRPGFFHDQVISIKPIAGDTLYFMIGYADSGPLYNGRVLVPSGKSSFYGLPMIDALEKLKGLRLSCNV